MQETSEVRSCCRSPADRPHSYALYRRLYSLRESVIGCDAARRSASSDSRPKRVGAFAGSVTWVGFPAVKIARSWIGSVCLVGALLLVTSAAAARSGLVEHCGGRVLTAAKGTKVGASHISVTAQTYNATRVTDRAVRPTLGCTSAKRELRAFMLAALERPLTRCAAMELRSAR